MSSTRDTEDYQAIHELLAAVASWAAPGVIVLLVKDADMFRNVAIDYHTGPRYPRLERANGTHDLLGEILAPR